MSEGKQDKAAAGAAKPEILLEPGHEQEGKSSAERGRALLVRGLSGGDIFSGPAGSGKDSEAAPVKSLPAPDLGSLFDLLKQQCGYDRSYDVSADGRFVIVTKSVDVMHSDSTNPQREAGNVCDVYDLTAFKSGTLFPSCYSKRFVVWYSRGGMSGYPGGSVTFAKGEQTTTLNVSQYGKTKLVPLPIAKQQ